jgi:archaemetzincin
MVFFLFIHLLSNLLLVDMRIAILLVGTTLPGFHSIILTIRKEFRSSVSMRFMDPPLSRAFKASHNQYDADLLLHELVGFASPESDYALFITKEDLYSEPLNFVFGLAHDEAAIVSIARLDPRFYGAVKESDRARAGKLFRMRIEKEMIHELGHAFSLGHCDDPLCVMVFSNSIDDVDKKGARFCGRCRERIKSVAGKD